MRYESVKCSRCGEPVTQEFLWPYDGPLVVAAWVECPECIEKDEDETEGMALTPRGEREG